MKSVGVTTTTTQPHSSAAGGGATTSSKRHHPVQQHPAKSQQQSEQQVRHLTPADLPRIEHICKNVYGGMDVLPRTIRTQLLGNQAATVLVSQPMHQDCQQQQPAVTGVVCAEVRGDTSYLFGLRVAEEARGNRVASQLMAAATQHGCRQPHVQHIQSTTIPPNTPAVRVFRRLGFLHSRTVDRWPQEHLQSAYELAVDFAPNREAPDEPVQFKPQQPHMLDHIPGARALISAAAAGVQPSDWVCCRSVQQLQQAVASIRQQQEQQLSQQQQNWRSDGGYTPPLDWLPWVFEICPLRSSWVQQRVAAGEIFLLPAAHPPGHSQHNTSYAAAVVLSHSPLNQRMCAGVLAVQEAGVAAALAFAGSRVPHFVSYIDSGSRHSSGAVDPQLRLCEVLELGRQGLPSGKDYMCYLVFSREADEQQRGLPELVAGVSRL